MFGLPTQAPEVKQEPEKDMGVPIPPGFTTHVVNYQKNAGKTIVDEIKEKERQSILFGQIKPLIMSTIMCFIMRSPIFAVNNILGILKTAMNLFFTAITTSKVGSTDKLIIIAEVLGLILVAGILAKRVGFISFEPTVEEVVTTTIHVLERD